MADHESVSDAYFCFVFFSFLFFSSFFLFFFFPRFIDTMKHVDFWGRSFVLDLLSMVLMLYLD